MRRVVMNMAWLTELMRITLVRSVVMVRFSMSPATGVRAGSQVEYSGLQQALKSKDEEVARKSRIARDELNEQMEEDIENYARAKGIWTIARKCVSLQST